MLYSVKVCPRNVWIASLHEVLKALICMSDSSFLFSIYCFSFLVRRIPPYLTHLLEVVLSLHIVCTFVKGFTQVSEETAGRRVLTLSS